MRPRTVQNCVVPNSRDSGFYDRLEKWNKTWIILSQSTQTKPLLHEYVQALNPRPSWPDDKFLMGTCRGQSRGLTSDKIQTLSDGTLSAKCIQCCGLTPTCRVRMSLRIKADHVDSSMLSGRSSHSPPTIHVLYRLRARGWGLSPPRSAAREDAAPSPGRSARLGLEAGDQGSSAALVPSHPNHRGILLKYIVSL